MLSASRKLLPLTEYNIQYCLNYNFYITVLHQLNALSFYNKNRTSEQLKMLLVAQCACLTCLITKGKSGNSDI